jgi:hypothetical protein
MSLDLLLGPDPDGLGWFGGWRLRRHFRKTPAVRIADLGEHSVQKVIGQAEPAGEALVSPFTGRPCVSFRVVGYRWTGSGRSRRRELMADEDDGHVFCVRDETGVAWAERRGHSLLLISHSYFSRPDPVIEGNLDAFFERYGHERRTFFDGFGSDFDYLEQVIAVGARIAVVGRVERMETAPITDGYRGDSHPMRLVPPGGPLLVTNETKLVR